MSGNNITRRPILFAGLAGLAAPSLARASTYPDRPIRLVIPFGGGGQTDIVSRVTAEALQQRLARRVMAIPCWSPPWARIAG
jgi:tripartite-type tricarboxylate transporter receptor subunit TctC